MNHTLSTGRWLAAVAAGAFVVTAGISPAAAVPDPAQYDHVPLVTRSFPLERIGTQFVRGDFLTGAGVPAPSYIPEQR